MKCTCSFLHFVPFASASFYYRYLLNIFDYVRVYLLSTKTNMKPNTNFYIKLYLLYIRKWTEIPFAVLVPEMYVYVINYGHKLCKNFYKFYTSKLYFLPQKCRILVFGVLFFQKGHYATIIYDQVKWSWEKGHYLRNHRPWVDDTGHSWLSCFIWSSCNSSWPYLDRQTSTHTSIHSHTHYLCWLLHIWKDSRLL